MFKESREMTSSST